MASVFGASMQKSIPAVRDTSRGRVLAIDYGTRRLGLALSDALRVTARPLATWTRTNRRRYLALLRDLCRLHEVDTIVVGWPLRLDGSEGDMANEARRFADRVRKNLGLHVELVDERLTSWQAAQPLDELAVRDSVSASHVKKRAGTLDDVAAAVILRDYLSRDSSASSGALHE
jgi:putative Holliday junction resolvase